MMVRFEEDEYTALAIFDAGNRVQTMEACLLYTSPSPRDTR